MYESLKKRFTDQFGTKPGFVFSAPGRTEIGGNHTLPMNRAMPYGIYARKNRMCSC